MPLPSQPFARKRYWVTEEPPAQPQPAAAAAAGPAKVRLADAMAARTPAPARSAARITLAPLAPPPAGSAAPGTVRQLPDLDGVRRLQLEGRFDADLLQALAQQLREASADEAVRCVLLESAGAWESGASVPAVSAPLECALPVIAAPPAASGAGFLLALHCDFLLLAAAGRYRCPAGLTPPQEALLRRRFGAGAGARLRSAAQGCSGRELDPAQRGAADPATEALALARQVAAAPRVSIVALKQHMRHGPQVPADLPVAAPLAAGAPEPGPVGSRALPLASPVIALELFDDGVLLLRMQEREHRNTFTPAFMEGMEQAFALIARTPECKVVVLTGHDHYFACGGTRDGLESLQRGATRFTDRAIYSLPLQCDLPVLAAMQGHAIGAGWSLALFCDHALLAAEAVYHSNYLWFGFTPGAGATLVFPHRFGDDLGREILFTAREYKGQELGARAPGQPVFPAAEVLPRALALAHGMARASRPALQAAKQERAVPLRALLADVFERELTMHQTTFVGNARVAERIASLFPAAPAAAQPAPAAAAGAGERARVRDWMARSLAEELMIEAQDIADACAFLQLGLDSILAVTWIRKLNAELGVALPATSVYAHPTSAPGGARERTGAAGERADDRARTSCSAGPAAPAVAPAVAAAPAPAPQAQPACRRRGRSRSRSRSSAPPAASRWRATSTSSGTTCATAATASARCRPRAGTWPRISIPTRRRRASRTASGWARSTTSTASTPPSSTSPRARRS